MSSNVTGRINLDYDFFVRVDGQEYMLIEDKHRKDSYGRDLHIPRGSFLRLKDAISAWSGIKGRESLSDGCMTVSEALERLEKLRWSLVSDVERAVSEHPSEDV